MGLSKALITLVDMEQYLSVKNEADSIMNILESIMNHELLFVPSQIMDALYTALFGKANYLNNQLEVIFIRP